MLLNPSSREALYPWAVDTTAKLRAHQDEKPRVVVAWCRRTFAEATIRLTAARVLDFVQLHVQDVERPTYDPGAPLYAELIDCRLSRVRDVTFPVRPEGALVWLVPVVGEDRLDGVTGPDHLSFFAVPPDPDAVLFRVADGGAPESSPVGEIDGGGVTWAS